MSEEGRGKDGWDGEASSCFIAWEAFRAGVGVHCSRRIKVMVPLGRGPWAGFLGLPCVCGAVRVRGAGETKKGWRTFWRWVQVCSRGVHGPPTVCTYPYPGTDVPPYRPALLAFAILRTTTGSLYGRFGSVNKSSRHLMQWFGGPFLYGSVAVLLCWLCVGLARARVRYALGQKEGEGCGFGSVPWAPSSGFSLPPSHPGNCSRARSRRSQISSPPSRR